MGDEYEICGYRMGNGRPDPGFDPEWEMGDLTLGLLLGLRGQ